MDVLLQREVRRWQLAGQDPHDHFRGLSISDEEAVALSQRPFGLSWGQTVSLSPAEASELAEAEAAARERVAAIRASARQAQHTLRFDHLQAAFNLTPFDCDSLLICLAPTLDLRYERLYGYLQNDVTRKRPTINLLLDLLGPTGPDRLGRLTHFEANAPLIRNGLLHRTVETESGRSPSPLSASLTLDETVTDWLLGNYQTRSPYITLSQPAFTETDQLLIEAQAEELANACAAPGIIIFSGLETLAQQAGARFCATQLHRPLLCIDWEAAHANGEPALFELLRQGLRDARLTGALPWLVGWPAGLSENGLTANRLLAEISRAGETCLLSGREEWPVSYSAEAYALQPLTWPMPDTAARLKLWAHFVGSPPTPELAVLAGQFSLTSAQIRDAVAAAQGGRSAPDQPLDFERLYTAARAQASHHLSDLARKLTPRYAWTDLILPAEQHTLLREIVDMVRGRPRVLEEWGVGGKLTASAGVTVLFAGPPGTGKTMAAEVMAAELGLDIYLIDLSTVVSKYIGETEKNLERIFSEAQNSSAILFFDEADAIFGKRSEVKDAHDRYANIEVSYLLQRMEIYDGVTILATNLRANLDEAFTRRLHFVVDFPFPDEAQRLRIWQTLFPPGVPRAPDLGLERLAKRYKLSGGNIRNALVAAAYRAAAEASPVTGDHLLHAIRRELQKMGRLLEEAPSKSNLTSTESSRSGQEV